MGRVILVHVIPSGDLETPFPKAINCVPVHIICLTKVKELPVARVHVNPSYEYTIGKPLEEEPAARITLPLVLITFNPVTIFCDPFT